MTRIGVTGHQNIPADSMPEIRARVAAVLADAPSLTAVSCLAAGADQLVAEAALALGGALHVVVACADYRSTLSGADLQRYDRLVALAVRTVHLPYPAPSEQAYLPVLCGVLTVLSVSRLRSSGGGVGPDLAVHPHGRRRGLT